MKKLQDGNNKAQLVAFGVIFIIAVIVVVYLNHTGVIHFDKD